MEINLFNDASLAPQPRHRVRIEEFRACTYPDRFRVKVTIKLTPFQERPNMVIVARAELMDWRSAIWTSSLQCTTSTSSLCIYEASMTRLVNTA